MGAKTNNDCQVASMQPNYGLESVFYLSCETKQGRNMDLIDCFGSYYSDISNPGSDQAAVCNRVERAGQRMHWPCFIRPIVSGAGA